MRKHGGLSLEAKKSWTGRLFALPFYIGFVFFTLQPVLQSLRFSVSNVQVSMSGYAVKLIGLDNFKYVLTVDQNFQTNLVASVTQLLWQVPIILISSLFFAVILNSKFVGRTFVRAVFFLPVIIATGIIINFIKGDVVASNVLSGNVVSGGQIFKSVALHDWLVQMGLSSSIVSYLTTVSSSLFDLLWQTGIQMIIFLAGLQSIPPTLYEASAMEGATAWENFFKITVPMISPIILVNIVYTIVDNFTSQSNSVMQQVLNNTNLLRFGWAAAMSWTYFILIAVILAAVAGVYAKLGRNDG